jgi:hypothetical protein
VEKVGERRHLLNLRERLSKLIQLVYDSFMLCQTHSLGVVAGYSDCVKNKKSWAHMLYQTYMQHLHLLDVNKKIESEQFYWIFNQGK